MSLQHEGGYVVAAPWGLKFLAQQVQSDQIYQRLAPLLVHGCQSFMAGFFLNK